MADSEKTPEPPDKREASGGPADGEAAEAARSAAFPRNEVEGEKGLEPVPKLGRGRRRKLGYYFPPQQVISLFALIIGLIAVLALRDSCARGAGNFIKAFDPPPDGGAAVVPRP